eukprot:Pgem_evm1s13293
MLLNAADRHLGTFARTYIVGFAFDSSNFRAQKIANAFGKELREKYGWFSKNLTQ